MGCHLFSLVACMCCLSCSWCYQHTLDNPHVTIYGGGVYGGGGMRWVGKGRFVMMRVKCAETSRGTWQRGEAGGGRPGQHVEGWSNWASRMRKRGEACGGRPGREGEWSKNRKTIPATTSTTPSVPTTGHHQSGNDITRNTGRSGRQKALTRRSMRREERVTVQGPVKKPQPDGTSNKGGGGQAAPLPAIPHALHCAQARQSPSSRWKIAPTRCAARWCVPRVL